MILLKKLQLNNFLSHENTEINFSENEKALIDGASGAGKSSIFDAILWALYGQGRADNRSLVRKGAKKGSVCLELARSGNAEVGPDTVIITRSSTSAGKHTLEVAIQQPDGSRAAYPLSGVRELQAWIDKDLIGASYLLFVNSVAYVQGNTESFVGQTAPKRKELLLEIVKAEDYDKYYENARKTLSTLENDQQRASGQALELKTRLEPLQSRIGQREGHIKAIGDNSTLIKDIEPVVKDLEDKKASITGLRQTIDMLTGVGKGLLSDLNTAQRSLDAKEAKLASRPAIEKSLAELTETRTTYTTKLDGLRGTLAAASEVEAKRNEHYAKKPIVRNRERELGDYASRIEKILLEPVCPSGVDCPYSGDHTKQVEGLRENIKAALAETEKENTALAQWAIGEAALPPATDIRTITKDISDLERAVTGCSTDINKMTQDLTSMDEAAAEVVSLKKTIEEKTASLKEADEKKADAEKYLKEKTPDSIENDLISAKTKLRSYQDAVTRATSALESIDQDEKDLKATTEKIATLEESITGYQEKARKVAMVKDAFGSKGIETMVIDYLLPKLEDRINEVLSKLSDFRVRLDTQRKSADGESIIEGLFITILNELNEEMPFEAYSGGEKLKISVAISEALATMQRVGFRLFDETFIGLDENSTESFAEVLEGLQKNFSQVLVISHLLQIKELFDKKVAIVKNKSISYVKES